MLIRRFIPISAGAAHRRRRSHPCPRAEPGQDIAQRAGGLQDVVHRAEQGGVGGRGDPGIHGPRLHHRDVAPAFEGDTLTGHRRHLRRFLDADHASPRAHLVPQQAAAQPGPASHVQDHLPPVQRERLHQLPPVGLEYAGITIIGRGLPAIGPLPGGLDGEYVMCSWLFAASGGAAPPDAESGRHLHAVC